MYALWYSGRLTQRYIIMHCRNCSIICVYNIFVASFVHLAILRNFMVEKDEDHSTCILLYAQLCNLFAPRITPCDLYRPSCSALHIIYWENPQRHRMRELNWNMQKTMHEMFINCTDCVNNWPHSSYFLCIILWHFTVWVIISHCLRKPTRYFRISHPHPTPPCIQPPACMVVQEDRRPLHLFSCPCSHTLHFTLHHHTMSYKPPCIALLTE